MKKEIFYDQNAVKELRKFSKEVQRAFQAHIEILKQRGKLSFPEAKKIARNLFEIRVTKKGAYRGFYAYIRDDFVVILHFFRKKTQRTPLKNINLAKRRLSGYE